MVQAVPFHISASVADFPRVLPVCPTASQAVADGHDTPFKKEKIAPVGFGAGWMLQEVPFQPAASGTRFPVLFM